MNFNKYILVVAGEPNSVFLEIFFKTIKKLKIKNPLILIASAKLIKLQMKKLNINIKINEINYENLFKYIFYYFVNQSPVIKVSMIFPSHRVLILILLLLV